MLDSLTKLVSGSSNIASNVATLLMTIAFIVFLFAVINYIWKRRAGEKEGLAQSGNMLFGSVFALFVMVAVWGLTNFIANNLNIGIGGCTERPSPVPGQPAITDCRSGTTSNASQSGSANTTRPTSCVQPLVLVNGRCEKPAVTSTSGGSSSGGGSSASKCQNGIPVTAANGETLSCPNGAAGEACTQGTCGFGFDCSLIGDTSYGACVAI
jgi:uncharacterized membrane protein YgcG